MAARVVDITPADSVADFQHLGVWADGLDDTGSLVAERHVGFLVVEVCDQSHPSGAAIHLPVPQRPEAVTLTSTLSPVSSSGLVVVAFLMLPSWLPL